MIMSPLGAGVEQPLEAELDPYLKEIVEEGKVKEAIAAELFKQAERRALEDESEALEK